MAASPDLSLVIPVFNEVGNLRTLQERIGAALDPLAMPYEVIYVDDGSQDGSYELLESLAAKD
ncbi:MAG TPA: glycosyltransferase, partial [Armatimonadota bacterium]